MSSQPPDLVRHYIDHTGRGGGLTTVHNSTLENGGYQFSDDSLAFYGNNLSPVVPPDAPRMPRLYRPVGLNLRQAGQLARAELEDKSVSPTKRIYRALRVANTYQPPIQRHITSFRVNRGEAMAQSPTIIRKLGNGALWFAGVIAEGILDPPAKRLRLSNNPTGTQSKGKGQGFKYT